MSCEVRNVLFTVKDLEDACRHFLIQADRCGMVHVDVFLFFLDQASPQLREKKSQCFAKLNNTQAHTARL